VHLRSQLTAPIKTAPCARSAQKVRGSKDAALALRGSIGELQVHMRRSDAAATDPTGMVTPENGWSPAPCVNQSTD
jgi:hypothetical protein